MRIAVFDQIGEGAGFVIGSAPMPEPGPGQIRFRVAAFAINQADLLLVAGRHYVQTPLPIRVGYEGAGIVDAVGTDVSRFRPGDRVTVIPNVDGPFWTAGEYALADERFATPWPDGYEAVEAASLWMQHLTPYYPFAELFPFAPGEWVMITAASGGTGLGSIRIAKLLGARVIATTRSPHKEAALHAHGADVVLSTERPDFVEAVRAATGGVGVRLINDTLCGGYVEPLTRTLADRGVIFISGALGAEDNLLHLPVLNLVHRGAGLFGYSLINELRVPGRLERGRDYVLDALTRGALPRPTIDRVFPLDQVAEAYARMRSGAQLGKIVVSLDA